MPSRGRIQRTAVFDRVLQPSCARCRHPRSEQGLPPNREHASPKTQRRRRHSVCWFIRVLTPPSPCCRPEASLSRRRCSATLMRRSPKPSCRRMPFRKRRSRPTRALRRRGLDSPSRVRRQLLLSLRLESFVRRSLPRRPCPLCARATCVFVWNGDVGRIGIRSCSRNQSSSLSSPPLGTQSLFQLFLCLKHLACEACEAGKATAVWPPLGSTQLSGKSERQAFPFLLPTPTRGLDALGVLRERAWLWGESLQPWSPCSSSFAPSSRGCPTPRVCR